MPGWPARLWVVSSIVYRFRTYNLPLGDATPEALEWMRKMWTDTRTRKLVHEYYRQSVDPKTRIEKYEGPFAEEGVVYEPLRRIGCLLPRLGQLRLRNPVALLIGIKRLLDTALSSPVLISQGPHTAPVAASLLRGSGKKVSRRRFCFLWGMQLSDSFVE
ncbi:hypothetical protein BDW66DRAFT_119477 [Aspergillus desertorum]